MKNTTHPNTNNEGKIFVVKNLICSVLIVFFQVPIRWKYLNTKISKQCTTSLFFKPKKFAIYLFRLLKYPKCQAMDKSCKWKDLVLRIQIANPKILCKYLNSQQTIRDSIKALKRQDGVITHYPREIVVILNKNFQETFVIEDYGPLPLIEQRTKLTSILML